MSVLLPLPLTPVTQMNVPIGKVDVDALEVVLGARRAPPAPRPLPRRRISGHGHRPLPVEELRGDRSPGLASTSSMRAGGDHVATVLAGAGTDVDHVVGGADGVLVVLDHDERVADVAQPLERADQLVVVALVQPDRRLVEDVEHAHEPAADLRGQPDALGLAAAQRGRAAVERQVVEADVVQEAEAFADLLEHLASDQGLALTELEALDAAERGDDAVPAQVHDVHAVDGDRQVLGLQPPAMARGARLLHHQPLDLLLDPVRLGLAVAALEVVDHPLEAGVVAARVAAVADVADAHCLVLGQPVEDAAAAP